MKYLALILTLTFSLPAIAANWMQPDNLGPGFELQKSCEASGMRCQQVDGLNLDALKTVVEVVDDLQDPIWEARSNVTICEGPEDCFAKIPTLCPEGYQAFANIGFSEVYCTRILGYNQKSQLKIVEDAAKIALLAAEKAALEAKAKARADALARIESLETDLDSASTVTALKLQLKRILADLRTALK
jgi:hypothetical protein